MDLGIKQSESEFMGELERGKTAANSQTLRQQQLNLQDELRDRMTSGDAAGVIRIQNLLKDLPVAITAAEIRELREGIDKATANLAEIKEMILEAERIRGEKNKILGEKIQEMEEAGLAVRRAELALFQLDQDAESQRETRRTYRQRLEKYLADADRAMGENNNGF